MTQNMPAYIAVAAAAGAGSKVMDLPIAFCGFVSLAVFAVCIGVSSFTKVEVPVVAPKERKPKVSKAEKRAAAAKAQSESVEVDPDAEKKAAKALKKREKERAKKEEKKAAALEAAQAAAAAEAAKAEEAREDKKKAKKKKGKKKGDEKETKKEEAPVKQPEAPVNQGWEEVAIKNKKPKKEEIAAVVKGEEHTELLYVEKSKFGAVIGRKGPEGNNLEQIIAATGCTIELPKDGGMRREILITGSVAGCKKAKHALEQLVAKGYCDLTSPGMIDSVISVPAKKLSVLIGPGGKTIKAIQEKTGVKINTPDKGSDSDDVSLVGSAADVARAMTAIKELLDNGFCSLIHENFRQVSVEVPQNMLKNLIGPGGTTIRALQDSTKVRINVPKDTKNDEVVIVSLVGEPEQIADCRLQIAELLKPPPPTPIAAEWTKAASLQHLDW